MASSQCLRCVAEGGCSGFNEMAQFERFLEQRGQTQHGIGDGAAAHAHHYAVSWPPDASGACLAFNITHQINATVPHHQRGGSSFRVEIEGDAARGGGLELCCVHDRGDGSYAVTCPRRAMMGSACAHVSVVLGFERFGAFANALPSARAVSSPCVDAGGYRRPLDLTIAKGLRWCEPEDGRADEQDGAADEVREGTRAAHALVALRGLRPSPMQSCRSLGVWMRSGPRLTNNGSHNAALPPLPMDPRRDWWEQRYAFVDTCEASTRETTAAVTPPPPPSAATPASQDAAPSRQQSPPGPSPPGPSPPGPSPHRQSPHGQRARSEPLFRGRELLRARGSLRRVHLIGESHLALAVDCLAAGHERAGHLEPAAWRLPHRVEAPDPAHPYDGYLAEARAYWGPHTHSARAPHCSLVLWTLLPPHSAPRSTLHTRALFPPPPVPHCVCVVVHQARTAGSTRPWAECSARRASCWATWNGSAYADHPQTGVETFARRCWQWRGNATGRGVDASAAAAAAADADGSAAEPPRGSLPGAGDAHSPPPLVCKHDAAGAFRAAMVLRLMIADAEAAAAADEAGRGGALWDARDVLVVQGGTWDTMCFRTLDEHLTQDLPPLVDAVVALRASRVMRGARVLLLTLPAFPPTGSTTGCRNSWAHAAANAALRRRLEAAAATHRGLMSGVTVLDQLGVTWPREHASPDNNHYVRRKFSVERYNAVGGHHAERRGYAVPRKDDLCIGDAGLAATRALVDEIEARGEMNAESR